jgi:hydrogenase/urease accessory protein HupE
VGTAAWAHDERFSASNVDVKDNEVIWTLDVATVGLEKVLKLPAPALKLTEPQLQEMKGDIVTYLLGSLKVEINGVSVEAEPGTLEPVYDTLVASGEKYIAYARQQFRFRSATKVERVTLSAALFLTVTSQHHAALTVSWNGAQRPFSRFGPFELELTASRVNQTLWHTAGEFVVWGMRHIFIGYDHIAFLLGLLLAARKLREMVKVVTSFTLAHSLTLLLSAMDVIHLRSGLTESLIAASIVYVAAENYFLKDDHYRWIISFAFGLIHGLGFSSVLRDRLQDLQSILVPVVSFNIGVELGQMVILLIALPVLILIRRGPDAATTERHQWWLIRVGSMPILLLGLFWLTDRAFQLNLMPF